MLSAKGICLANILFYTFTHSLNLNTKFVILLHTRRRIAFKTEIVSRYSFMVINDEAHT